MPIKYKGATFTLEPEGKPLLSDEDFKTFPMFVAELRGMEKKHDYLDCKYDLTTGEQVLEEDETDEHHVNTLKYRMGVELKLLRELGDEHKAAKVQEFIDDIDRRLAQDPNSRTYLKAFCDEAIAYHWDQEMKHVNEKGREKIQRLKLRHKRAIEKKRRAIEAEHRWLDGESWAELIDRLKKERSQNEVMQQTEFERLLNKNRMLTKQQKKDMYVLETLQQDAQLERSNEMNRMISEHHKNLQKDIQNFKCRDPYTEEIEVRHLRTEHLAGEQQAAEERRQMREEQQQQQEDIWADMAQTRQAHRRQQERVHDELKVAEQGLRVQNAVTRRVEKMEVRLELEKQHHERVEWVYEQKLKKKLNLVHKKELRDHARLKEKPPADVVDKFGRTFRYIWLKPHDHEGEDDEDEDEDDEDEDDEGALPPPV